MRLVLGDRRLLPSSDHYYALARELDGKGDGAVIKECGHGRRGGVWMYLL